MQSVHQKYSAISLTPVSPRNQSPGRWVDGRFSSVYSQTLLCLVLSTLLLCHPQQDSHLKHLFRSGHFWSALSCQILALTDGHEKSLYYKESMPSGSISVKGLPQVFLLKPVFWDGQKKKQDQNDMHCCLANVTFTECPTGVWICNTAL